MTVSLHPEMRVRRLSIGREGAPLLVVDNLVKDPNDLVELAATKVFTQAPYCYPGLRVKAPLTYQRFILETLRTEIDSAFGLVDRSLRFSECNFSLLMNDELAMIHYLFRANHGGTAFYRHRRTGFEYVDQPRQIEYQKQVEAEKAGPDSAPPAYIIGDSPLYERIAGQDGIYNRLLMYRRTSLHSPSISPDFIPDPDPRTGRLSINAFLA
jgi:hypothetical protein